MLVSKETSQARKERHDLIKLMEKQHQEMRDRLLETKIGIEPIHSPINRVEAQICTLEEIYDTIGAFAQLKEMREDLKAAYDKMLNLPEMEQPAVSPVELYEAKLSVIQDALSILERGQVVKDTQSATDAIHIGIEPIEPSKHMGPDFSYHLRVNGRLQQELFAPEQVFEKLEELSQAKPITVISHAYNRSPYKGIHKESDQAPSFKESENTISVIRSESGSYDLSVNGEWCGSRNQPQNAFALLSQFSRNHPVQVTYQDQMDLSLSEEDLAGLSQETGIEL